MITDYLFLGPRREILCTLKEIRQYVEEHYEDRHLCPQCGCYLIPSVRPRRILFRTYRCINAICATSFRVSRLLRPLLRRAA